MTAPTRGIAFGKDRRTHAADPDFARSIAIVVGIDDYANGIPPLKTAVNDARRLARLLRKEHGYTVYPVITDVTAARLLNLLGYEVQTGENDRMLFYFAGHGIALDAEWDKRGDKGGNKSGSALGPQGYLIPQDADPTKRDSFVPMELVDRVLSGYQCRHMLVILDCCFAGSFRWAGTSRDMPQPPQEIHKERYLRYIKHQAWQVITSAAHDQKALDVLGGDAFDGTVLGRHGEQSEDKRLHSPFARMLMDALKGAADRFPDGGDGLLTATELYLYLREEVERNAKHRADHDQTPGLWPLKRHDKGEYVFRVPGKEFNPPPAPELTAENNPYLGLRSYTKDHANLFFGRSKLVDALRKELAQHPFVAVLGVSGSGKSSLVNAGLLPRLQGATLTKPSEDQESRKTTTAPEPAAGDTEALCDYCLDPFRPGNVPHVTFENHLRVQLFQKGHLQSASCDDLVRRWLAANPKRILLIAVDQFEEVITLCRKDEDRRDFLRQLHRLLEIDRQRLRLILTLRLDFATMVSDLWNHHRDERESSETPWREFLVTPMSNDELREAIEKPATARVLFFDPPELVQRLIDDVQQSSAALPLISFTLSELYTRRDPANRTLSMAEYERLEGVLGALRHRANEEYDKLGDPEGFGADYQATMRRLMLRMVAFEGGELTRRRVPKSELVYADDTENLRVQTVLNRLVAARLIVSGTAPNASGDDQSYYEPAHDKLINAWDKLLGWYAEDAESQPLVRRITLASDEWQTSVEAEKKKRLWHDEPLLDDAEVLAATPELRPTANKDPDARRKRPSRIVRFWQRLFPQLQFSPREPLLNLIETRFVHESIRRRRNLLRSTIGIVSGVMVSLILLTGLAYQQMNEAERQKSEAEARAVISHGREAVDRDTSLALLLFAKVVRDGKAQVPEAETVLREVMQEPVGVLLRGHTSAIYDVVFDPSGRWLASGSEDGTARVWDLRQPVAEPRVLNGHESIVYDLALDPSGRWLVTGSRDNTARLWDLKQPDDNPVVLYGHEDNVEAVAFDRTGHWLATGSADNTARLWDLRKPDADPVVLRGHENGVSHLAFDPGDHWLATGSWDHTVRLWDLRQPDADPVVLRGHEDSIYAMAFHAGGRWLATGSADNTARLWDLKQPNADPLVLRGHENLVHGVAFAPSGHWLATGSHDNTVRLWDLRQPDTEPVVLRGHEDPIVALAFAPDGRWLATGSDDNTARLWDLRKPYADPLVLRGHENLVHGVAFAPSGRWLATGSHDNTARLWDLRQPDAEPLVLRGHGDRVHDLAFDPSGRWLATGSFDNTARLWDLRRTDIDPIVLRGHEARIRALAFAPDGRWLATGSFDNTARLWNLRQTDAEPVVLRGHEDFVFILTFDPAGRWLATGSGDKTTRLWDLREPDAKPVVLRGHEEIVYTLAFDPSGRWLATGSGDKTARLWDLQQPDAEPVVLLGHEDSIWTLAFDPSGRWLATGSGDNTARLWDLRQPEAAPVVLSGHGGFVITLAFDPDGRWLATGSDDNTVRLWDLREPAVEPVVLRGHDGEVRTLVFDPGGRRLATGSWDNTVRLWDLRQLGAEPVILRGHEDLVHDVAFDPTGRWLATGSEDNTARVWDLDLDSLLKKACGFARRNLSLEEWNEHVGAIPYQITCPDYPRGAVAPKPTGIKRILSRISALWQQTPVGPENSLVE